MNARQSFLRGGAVLLAALSLSACVSTPYVRINSVQPAPSSGPPSLPAAIQHAEAVQDLYRDKLIALGDAERNLSTGLIALGGVMLGLGVAQAHHSAIEGAAILGGTTYTIGRFSTDKRRAAVYGAGLEALNCAVDAVSPLNLGSKTLDDVNSLRGDTGSGRAAVLQAAGEVTALLASMPQKSATPARTTAAQAAAREALRAAQVALTNSTDAAADGDRLVHRYEQAGAELRNAVKTIDTQVLNTMRALEVDLRAVPDALSRLMDNTGLFSNLSTSAANASPTFALHGAVEDPTKAADAATINLEAATFVLQMKVAAMEHQTQRLARLVQNVSAGIQDNIRDCKVQLPFFVMTVSPATVTFTTGVAGTQTLYVSGGQVTPTSAFATSTTFTFSAEFTSSPHTGLSLTPADRKLRISADATTVPGNYPIRVEDTTGGGVQTVMVVVAAASTSLDAAAAKARLEPLKDSVISVAGGKVKLLSFDVAAKKLDVKYSKVEGVVTNDAVKEEIYRIQLKGFNLNDLSATLVP